MSVGRFIFFKHEDIHVYWGSWVFELDKFSSVCVAKATPDPDRTPILLHTTLARQFCPLVPVTTWAGRERNNGLDVRLLRRDPGCIHCEMPWI